jgi:hypothetical protein
MAYAQRQWQPKEEFKPVKATDSMSGPQQFMAGMGKGFVDLGRGAGQMLGLVDQRSIDEAKAQDADLMGTGAGLTGNIAGNLAGALPAALIPGANTVLGAGAVGGALGALQPTATGESRLRNAVVGGATGGAAQYGLGKAAQYATNRLANKTAEGAAQASQNSVRDAALQSAREADLVVPPVQANPSVLNRLAEGYAGKISTAQGASIKNQPKLDALIKSDLGIPANKPVTPELLEGIRSEAGKAYEAVKKAGKLPADEQFVAEINALGGAEYAAVVRDVPELANAGIGNLTKALDKAEFDSATAVSLIKKLRRDAKVNYKNRADPDKLALADAQSSAAEALENLAERTLTARGMPEAVQNLRAARVKIAQTHMAEDALDAGTGSFAAQPYAKAFDAGKPLGPGAKRVGQFANTFPKAAQEIKSSMPGVSPLDYAAVGGISAATGIPSLLAGVIGRPLVRSGLLSGAYQRGMAGPQHYGPGLLTKAAPNVLEELERLGLGGLLGGSVYAPQ